MLVSDEIHHVKLNAVSSVQNCIQSVALTLFACLKQLLSQHDDRVLRLLDTLREALVSNPQTFLSLFFPLVLNDGGQILHVNQTANFVIVQHI